MLKLLTEATSVAHGPHTLYHCCMHRAGGVGLGHVTNYAQNVDGTVWDLQQLAKHMGRAAYDALWGRMAHSAALMVRLVLHVWRIAVPPDAQMQVDILGGASWPL